MNDELEMLFRETAFSFGEFVSGPGAAVAHRFATVVQSLLEGDAGAFPSASGGGKEPVGVAMPLPEGTKSEEESG